MKAIYFLKLSAATAMVMVGLTAAEAGHTQAPSGPITAAPAQPGLSGAPSAANPAPATAPRTTILGVWKFNPDDSDDPSKRRQESQGSSGGGRGRMGGNWPGGGGYGGHRGGGVGESDEQREKMRELFTPARKITLSMTGAEVDLVDDHDRKMAFMTDGRKLQKSKDAGYQEIAAKFEGNRLASDEKDPRGNKMSRTFELSEDGRQLYETLHMVVGREKNPRVIRYVYDIPISAQSGAPPKQ